MDETLQQIAQEAVAAAKLDATAQIEMAKVDAAREERRGVEAAQEAVIAEHAMDTAVEIAKIEAATDVQIAEIHSDNVPEAISQCCMHCMEHATMIGELKGRIAALEAGKSEKQEVQKIDVGKKKEEEKKKEKRGAFLYL